jgi:hypothetical protein
MYNILLIGRPSLPASLSFFASSVVPVAEASVIIAVSSPHRREALAAVEYGIDTLKATVPIWKKVGAHVDWLAPHRRHPFFFLTVRRGRDTVSPSHQHTAACLCSHISQELYANEEAQWKANCEGCLRARQMDLVNHAPHGERQ